jgi:hypothetical protein
MFDWVGTKLSELAAWFLSIFTQLSHWVESIVSQSLNYLYILPLYVYESICDSFVKVFHSIPAPDFFADAANLFSNINSGVLYYVAPLQLDYGIGILLSAYTLRFLIRRIPFFG